MSIREGYTQTEVGVIPENWEVAKLGDYCDILDNLRVPISSEKRADIQGDIPYYGANGVQDYINDYIYNETLVLLAEDGGNFNEYQTRPIAYMIHGKSWVNNHTHVLRAKNGENYFLFYSLVHKDITSFINGGTRAKLNRGELVKIPITLPPLQEQKKIAEILSTVDQKIGFVNTQIEQTKILKKGLMQKLLTEGIGHTEFKDTKLGKVPVCWEVTELDNVSDSTRLAGYEYSEYWEEKSTGEIIALKGYNIGKGKINTRDTFYITDKLSQQLNRSRLYKGDVVFPCVGTIGNAVAITESNKYHINQNIAKITPYEKLDSNFLVQYLMSMQCRKEIFRFNATTSQPNVLVGSLRKFRIPVPPIKEQKQIAEILSTTDEKLEALREKKESFEELKKGLMQKLLTGEVRV